MNSNSSSSGGPVRKKLGVLFGGRSSEREVSLATGRYILNLLDPARFLGIPVYMDFSGQLWELPLKLVIMNTTKDIEQRLRSDAKRVRYEELKEKVDLVFNALLGKYGENGCVQGLLELLKVPYTGSGILSSAITMNKHAVKQVLASKGFMVARDILVTKSNLSEAIKRVAQDVGYPLIVKPIAEGSSVGVSYVATSADLGASLDYAFEWDQEVLIEEYIKGQEFMCVVFGQESPLAMLPSEVEFSGNIFTYESKYMPGKAVYHTPIRASEERIKAIQKMAVETYQLFGISGYGRVDGFLTDDGRIYVSELHTGTIMVPSSYVFQQASLQPLPSDSVKGSFKGKGGNKFNPRTFISSVIDMGEKAHSSKIGCL